MGPRTKRIVAGLAALCGAAAVSTSSIIAASDDARTISFYHIHTKETLTVLYKKNGAYIPDALEKINWIMRDWRKNEVKTIDPATIDLIWEMHTELGSREPVNIICGYRSHATNEMLRKNVGGQASQSQHITGKAVDIAFPDIPARQLRYSALVRERGGVGYYPTSAIPFVHVDSGRVRHWPRMPRDELALLFPSGRSKYEPADGRPITPADVQRARANRKDLATEVAAYFDRRDNIARPTTMVADASATAPIEAPAPKPVARPTSEPPAPEMRMAMGGPAPSPEEAQEAAPKLAAAPRLVERPSRFSPAPSAADRKGLDNLVTLASLEESLPAAKPDPAPAPATPPVAAEKPPQPPARPAPKKPMLAGMTAAPNLPAARKEPQAAPAAGEIGLKLAALEAEWQAETTPQRDADESWAQAPEFDEDHPEELSYRPFPLSPLLTETASPDDPALVTIRHPDIAKTLDVLDDDGSILPMRLRPGRQTAELMWAQEFRGEAVNIAELEAKPAKERALRSAVAERSVKTMPR